MTACLIGLDWGTTHVRAALLDADAAVLDERRGASGVGKHDRAGFEATFDKLTRNWPLVSTIACGMVGSRQGWVEAPYRPCPAAPSDISAGFGIITSERTKIAVVPGLKCEADGIFDVMRGEETQIAGLLFDQPDFTGTIVLPGTHSKWVKVVEGSVVSFKTFMTGEIFSLLRHQSVLASAVEDHEPMAAGMMRGADFDKGVALGVKGGWGALFALRAEHLLAETGGQALGDRLSGLLIGAELGAAKSDGWLERPIQLIGGHDLIDRYRQAAEGMDVAVTCHDGGALVWRALLAMAKERNLLT